MDGKVKDSGYFSGCADCMWFFRCSLELSSIKSLYELECGYKIKEEERKRFIAASEAEYISCPFCNSLLKRVEFLEITSGEIILTKNGNYARKTSTEMECHCPCCHRNLKIEEGALKYA